MNAIFDFFQYIVNLGVSVMMPLIITVLGLIFGNKFSASFKIRLNSWGRVCRVKCHCYTDDNGYQSCDEGVGRKLQLPPCSY